MWLYLDSAAEDHEGHLNFNPLSSAGPGRGKTKMLNPFSGYTFQRAISKGEDNPTNPNIPVDPKHPANPHYANFEGKVDWLRWKPAVDYAGVDDPPHY